MRWRPVLLGGATATAGAVLVVVFGAEVVQDGAWGTEGHPPPIVGVVIGGFLVVLGLGLLRDLRRSPAGPLPDPGPDTTLFPYQPPRPDAGWAGSDPSADCGGSSGGDTGGGGGGDCGGSGGGS